MGTLRLAAFLVVNLIALSLPTAVALAGVPTMPTFYARRDYQGIGSQTNGFVQVADTNGDGVPDLISTAEGSITVWLGNGDGTFQAFITGTSGYAMLAPPYSFAVGDVNGDGKVDLVLACPQGIAIPWGSVQVFMGNGDGTFQDPVVYRLKDGQLTHLVLGDFNGDGIPDIAAAGASYGVWLLTGIGNGVFNPAVLAISLEDAFNIASADFNGDGKLDLVVTDSAGFDVFLGDGNGTFQPPQTFSTPVGPVALAVGSLTAGGPASIAVNADRSNVVYVYPGNGAGSFSTPITVGLPGGHPDDFALGDINGDGIADLVSQAVEGAFQNESFVYVALGESGGGFNKPVVYPIEASNPPGNVVLADLRGNGLEDIVGGGDFGASVLLNAGKGYFEDGVWTSVAGAAYSGEASETICGATADFNGDGRPDLAINTPTGIALLFGTGGYVVPFTAGYTITLAGAGCPVSGDLNGDGIPDILVPVLETTLSKNALVFALLGNGDGTFRLASTTPTISNVYQGEYLALADFNGDGKLDFASAGNLLALGNGDGTFQKPTVLVSTPPYGEFSGIVAGDINNDGWPDLVITNGQDQSNLAVLLNNQQGGFTQAITSIDAGQPVQPTLVDLNGDGNLDLVVTASGANGVYLLLGNGAGSFTSPKTICGPLGAYNSYYSVADVNGDGIADIVVTGLSNIGVCLGQGNATYMTQFFVGAGPSPGGILVENLHGQSPTAGLPDIVVPDTTGGVMVLLNLTP